ncbi:MAG: efflux RND transporter periplasmic adaptor subunit [Bradyrhizobiaceae bacterium]|nr:efflux RND transporter periplasmic adaptor subunit [Bradyrhizobiaceae bacterium]
MKASHIVSVGIVAAAVVWIGSGYFLPHESPQSTAAIKSETAAENPFRVAVVETNVVDHSSKLVLSGRTQADKKVTVAARTGGVVTELRVQRGDFVKKGDVIAVLSDEARDAQVMQARAKLAQKTREREARQQLIEKGTLPRLNLLDLEAQEKAAEAALAAAEAELDRGQIRAPWSGIVNAVPAELGQTMLASGPMGGANEIAHLISLDPIIAVVEVSERRLNGLKIGTPAEIRLVTGETAAGKVRYISKSASETTRTYRVDIEAANPENKIPDGITVEVAVSLAPTPATEVPRSALIFSSGGDLGVRIVKDDNSVDFVPVTIAEDRQQTMWVAGVPDRARVIVQGQDFVREGQRVEAVAAADLQTARK